MIRIKLIVLYFFIFYCSACSAQQFGIKAYTSWSKWHQGGTEVNKFCPNCFNDTITSNVTTKMEKLFDYGFGLEYLKKYDKLTMQYNVDYQHFGIGVKAENFYTDGFMLRQFDLYFLRFTSSIGKEFKFKGHPLEAYLGLNVSRRFKNVKSMENSELTFFAGQGQTAQDEILENFEVVNSNKDLGDNTYIFGANLNVESVVKSNKNLDFKVFTQVSSSFNNMYTYIWKYNNTTFAVRQHNKISVELGLKVLLKRN